MTGLAAAPLRLAGPRLTRLFWASRRVPAGLGVLAAIGITLRIVLHWTPATGTYSVMFPLIVETAAASVVAATTRSPFGEPERATGRWLPFLRLATVIALSCVAFGALAAGAAGGHLVTGVAGLLRDVAGLTGVALLTAAVTGGSLSWTGPLTYLVLSIYAVGENWTTPWLWPARPPGDRGAAVCAALVFAAGAAIAAARGARETSRD
jgi:hypothetical protein